MLAFTAEPQVTLVPASPDHGIDAGDRALPIHVGGRSVVSRPAAPASRGARNYRHQWPALYWEAAFAGDRLSLRFDDDKNEYRLSIDDAAPIALKQPGRATVAIRGLGSGRHKVRLDKITESVDFTRTFAGFFVPPNGTALPSPPPRVRQIEFVGDSGMTGYGIRSASRICTKEEVRLQTDSGAAWPSLVARAVEADYQIVAMSGRGLVRNYGGAEPTRSMSALYPRTLPDAPVVWHDPAWRPQVVVVVLFADFATDLHPGERWRDPTALVDAYARAYARFVALLHRRAPGATLLFPWPDFTGNDDPVAHALSTQAQTAIRAAATKAGVSRIEFPVLPTFAAESSACDSHGSRDDHRRLAAWMTAWLNAQPMVWHPRRTR